MHWFSRSHNHCCKSSLQIACRPVRKWGEIVTWIYLNVAEPEVLYIELSRQNFTLFLTTCIENILSPEIEKLARHSYQRTFIFIHIRDLALADKKICWVLLISEDSLRMLICNLLMALLIRHPCYWLTNCAT